jgi:general secretion pathway protein K
MRPTTKQRGAALLAVMWLSAALAAIAFSVANTVQGETGHTANSVDDIRSYYLATGAIERAVLRMQWGQPWYVPGQGLFDFEFPAGNVQVELLPESSKLNINQIQPAALLQLLLALGAAPEHAQQVAQAIVEWRTPVAIGPAGMADSGFGTLPSSFPGHHASFEEIEELLSVPGVTPDLYYGTFVRDASVSPPRLVARGGLRDCLSVYSAGGGFLDANAAAPAVLAVSGVPMEAVQALVARRPFHNLQELMAFTGDNPVFARVRLGGNFVYTLRAVARLRLPDGKLSDLRRTVSALVKLRLGFDPPYVVLRWYDRG